jgi:hypothetical protein
MSKTGDAPTGALLKYTSYICKHPNISETDFHNHWRFHHGRFPLEAMKKHGVVRYTQYHSTKSTRSLLEPMVNARKNNPMAKLRFEIAEFDAIVQIWFKGFEAWEAVAKEPIFGKAIFQDESYMFDAESSYTTLGWEEDMLVDGEIVMPGYKGMGSCACKCKQCEGSCEAK